MTLEEKKQRCSLAQRLIAYHANPGFGAVFIDTDEKFGVWYREFHWHLAWALAIMDGTLDTKYTENYLKVTYKETV